MKDFLNAKHAKISRKGAKIGESRFHEVSCAFRLFGGLFSRWGSVAGLGFLMLASARGAEAPKFRVGPSTELNEPGKKQVSDEAQKLARTAMIAMTKGDLVAAKRDFQKVLTLAPDNVATTINLGLVAYRQKQYAEAEKLLKRAVRVQPETGLGWLILGVVYYDQDKLEAALAALAQAALLEPKNATVHQYLGVTIGKKGWLSGAEDEMRKALEIDPNYAEAHFNLAVFYLQRNPPAVELARRHYQAALDLGAAPDPEVAKGLTDPKE
jgi:Tfp pilus assembly protein PilF